MVYLLSMALQDWNSNVVLNLSMMNGFKEGDKDVQKKYNLFINEGKRLGFVVTEVIPPDWKDIRDG